VEEQVEKPDKNQEAVKQSETNGEKKDG